MTTRPKFSRKAYNEFVRSVALDRIWLDELHVVRPATKEPERAELSIVIEGRHELRENDFDVFIRLAARFVPNSEDSEAILEEDDLLRIEIVYGATYIAESEVTIAMLDQFSQSSAQLALWPYLRETLQSTLLRSGLEGFVLPVFSSLP
jgi:preprotein translocase subunit SecB